MRTAVMLLSFNRLEYLKMTIDAYMRNTKFPHLLRIVDNGSVDGSREFIKMLEGSGIIHRQCHHIETEFVFYDKNEMYQKPVNEFWRNAPSDIKYFGRVLDDIIVQEGWLTEFVRVLDNHPKIGMITTGDGPEAFERATSLDPKRLYESNGEQFLDTGINGHCQLFRRSVIQEIMNDIMVPNDGYIEPRGVMAPAFHYGFIISAGYHVCTHPQFITRMADVDPILELQKTNKYRRYRNVVDAHKLGLYEGAPPENMYDGIPIVGEHKNEFEI